MDEADGVAGTRPRRRALPPGERASDARGVAMLAVLAPEAPKAVTAAARTATLAPDEGGAGAGAARKNPTRPRLTRAGASAGTRANLSRNTVVMKADRAAT